jgi:hypothetical protein
MYLFYPAIVSYEFRSVFVMFINFQLSNYSFMILRHIACNVFFSQ